MFKVQLRSYNGKWISPGWPRSSRILASRAKAKRIIGEVCAASRKLEKANRLTAKEFRVVQINGDRAT